MGNGKVDTPDVFNQIKSYASANMGMTGKPLREAMSQLTEALKTGGVGARIPMIQRAVEQQNQATSQALGQTAETLAQRNIGGTQAARIMAGTQLAGASAASRIPTDVAQQVISQGIPQAMGLRTMGFGGLQSAGSAQMATDQFNALQFKALMQDIKSSLQTTGGSFCLHPLAPVETPSGSRFVSELVPGATVWSRDEEGNRVFAAVIETAQRLVGPEHKMLRVFGADGEFFVTPEHPLPNGKAIGDVRPGEIVDNATALTCDIRVDGPTGVYFVCGVALGSTLDPRHRSA